MPCCGLWPRRPRPSTAEQLQLVEPPGTPNPKSVQRSVPRRGPALLSSKFIVAIDFGTTFTGVAWGHFAGSTDLDGGSTNTKILAERIFVHKEWPGTSRSYAEKTPTIISYATSPPTWGSKVRPQHKPQVSRFKLGLDPEKVRDVFQMEGGGGMVGLVPGLGTRSAVEVTGDFLTQLNRYLETEALPNAFGAGFLAAQSKLYVMTVPAIWSDRAKDLTRQAAARAGIPKERLILVTEPEAAAFFCATVGDQLD